MLLDKRCNFTLEGGGCWDTKLISNPKSVHVVSGRDRFVGCNRHTKILANISEYRSALIKCIHLRYWGLQTESRNDYAKFVRTGAISYSQLQFFFLQILHKQVTTKWKSFVKMMKFAGFNISRQNSLVMIGRSQNANFKSIFADI